MIKPASKIPAEWRPNERFVSICAGCETEILKKFGVAIYRKKGAEQMHQLMYLCRECYCNFLEDYAIGE